MLKGSRILSEVREDTPEVREGSGGLPEVLGEIVRPTCWSWRAQEAPPEGLGGVERHLEDRETSLEVRKRSGGPPVVWDGLGGPPEFQEGSRRTPGGPRGVRRTPWRSWRGGEAPPEVCEWSGGPSKNLRGLGGSLGGHGGVERPPEVREGLGGPPKVWEG